jgi:hypothetical protein
LRRCRGRETRERRQTSCTGQKFRRHRHDTLLLKLGLPNWPVCRTLSMRPRLHRC